MPEGTSTPFEVLRDQVTRHQTTPASFEAGPAGLGPALSTVHFRQADVIETLEAAPAAARRLEALRQHVHDLHSLCVPFEDIREIIATRIRAEDRLRQLTGHPSEGGHNLSEDDPRTVVAQREVEKTMAAATSIQERANARSAAWREASYALQAVESYLRDGVPGGCILQDVEPPEPKLAKGQGVLEAIMDVRQRGMKLRKRLSEIDRAPYPSSVAKARAREWVEALAQRGRIDVSPLIRREDGELALPIEYARVLVTNSERAPSAGTVSVPDPALLAWLNSADLIRKLEAEIDAAADDKAALTATQRAEATADVERELLTIERIEASLVWRALEQRLPVQHGRECHPLAVLSAEFAQLARPAAGTSPGHSFAIIGAGRR